MKWAALATWVITAGGGFVMLALWLQGGGMRQSGERRVIQPPLILGHFALAATGLVLWIIYVASESSALAWISFGLLVVVALGGFTMFAIWLQQRRGAIAPATTSGAPEPGSAAEMAQPAERRFPIPVVGAHGLFAATTLVLVVLTAAGVGS